MSKTTKTPPTRLEKAEGELRKVSEQLRRLERKNMGLADFTTALSLLANVQAVVIQEVRSLQREVMDISNELGDAELEREEQGHE